MKHLEINLFYRMAEMLWDHRSSRAGCYPNKFVLNDAQYIEYLRCIDALGKELGKTYESTCHMGVAIEIQADSCGYMLTNENEEVAIRSL